VDASGGFGGFTQGHYLQSNQPVADGHFGAAVAIQSSEVAAVGAPGEGTGQSGQVHVFNNASGWSDVRVLTCETAQATSGCGSAVAMDGNYFSTPDRVIAVGAPNDTPGSAVGEGGVWIFVRGADDTQWGRTAILRSASPVAGGGFGTSVSVFNDGISRDFWLIVGAPGEASALDRTAGAGAATIFFSGNGGNTWSQDARLAPAGPVATGDAFGKSVRVEDGFALVGAPGTHGNGHANAGAAWFYDNAGTHIWNRTPVLPANPVGDAYFGRSVSFSNNGMVISVPHPATHGAVEEYGRSGQTTK
jgi:hypothetical protein